MHYYFLLSFLPDLNLMTEPNITFETLKEMLPDNLREKDLKKVEKLLTLIDVKNIRLFLKDLPIDPRGNLEEKELEEALLVKDYLPEFVFDYFDQHEKKEDQIRFISELYTVLFKTYIEEEEGFLKAYFQFEREMSLVLLALRCQYFDKDLSKELQFEDPTDSMVAYILSQKDVEAFDPPSEYEELKTIFKENIDKPKELQKKVLEFRFHKIEEMEEGKIFGIEQMLSYLARLLIVEDWHGLDEKKGNAFIDSIG